MMSKKAIFAFALPLSFASAYAKVESIPKALEALKSIENQKTFVLKNAKGTLKVKSLLGEAPSNWFNLMPSEGAEGVGTEEVYRQFGLPQSEDVIVAVIDSGVDVNHEDLQGKIWINSKEIPNNGVDDDGNGYIDDVFGWNFIGGADGMAKIEADESVANGLRLIKGKAEAQIDADTLEVTRELVRMQELKRRLEQQGRSLNKKQAEYLAQVQKEVSESLETAKKVVNTYTQYKKTYEDAEKVLKRAGLQSISLASVRALESTDGEVLRAKSSMISLLSNGIDAARIASILDYYGAQAQYYYNVDFNPRTIVGDDYSNQLEKVYGNNDVIGPDSSHGTHVAGSIAAVRDNELGIKGVATNVKIMAVRVVPNGDERDKDVANGIRYAVDNGAKIINMSFGKSYSPYKSVVDEAVKYAEEKGVLLVHAAGNSNQDNDVASNFPNRKFQKAKREFSNWLEIGASSFEKGLNLPADFSNYGKKSVDFFAPGVDILSTTPDNTYDTYSGTSMAAPTASGVAALILNFAPNLHVEDVRSLMIDTSRRYPNLQVYKPGTESPILFSKLSRVGTVVDVLEAVTVIK